VLDLLFGALGSSFPQSHKFSAGFCSSRFSSQNAVIPAGDNDRFDPVGSEASDRAKERQCLKPRVLCHGRRRQRPVERDGACSLRRPKVFPRDSY
jgi:hypothetical protein